MHIQAANLHTGLPQPDDGVIPSFPVVYEETPLVDDDGAWWVADIYPKFWFELDPVADLSAIELTGSDMLTVLVHFNLDGELDRSRVIGKNLQVRDLMWLDEEEGRVLAEIEGGWRECWSAAPDIDAQLIPPAGEPPPQTGCDPGSTSFVAALNLDGYVPPLP